MYLIQSAHGELCIRNRNEAISVFLLLAQNVGVVANRGTVASKLEETGYFDAVSTSIFKLEE